MTVFVGSIRDADDAILHRQLRDRRPETVGGERKERLPGLGARLPERDAAGLDRRAPGGVALVRRARGIAHHHRDPREGDIEFVRDDLREGGLDAGAEFDLAGEDRHLAVAHDRQP